MNHVAESDTALPLIVQLVCPTGQIGQTELAAIRETQSKQRVSVEEILIRKGIANEQEIAGIRQEVKALCARFPIYPEF